MNGGLLAGYSGLRTEQFGLDVWSNNIANVNTAGFRQNKPTFKSLFTRVQTIMNSNSPVNNDFNIGSTRQSSTFSTTQGVLTPSDSPFHLAIQGQGWFVVGKQTANGDAHFDPLGDGGAQGGGSLKQFVGVPQDMMFTRDGSFGLDADGYLVNSNGYYVYGVDLGHVKGSTFVSTKDDTADSAAIRGTHLVPLRIPKGLAYRPVLSSYVHGQFNLNKTKNGKSITEILKTPQGQFDDAKFLQTNIDVMFSGPDNDKRNPPDTDGMKITLTDSTGKVTTKDVFYKEPSEHYVKDPANPPIIIKTFGDLKNELDKLGVDMDFDRYADGTIESSILKFKAKPSTVPGTPPKVATVSITGPMATDFLGIKDNGFELGSRDIKIPSYISSTRIYDAQGSPYDIKTDFFLIEAGDTKAKPPVPEKWGARSAIYESGTDGTRVSNAETYHEIEFDEKGKPTAAPVTLDFGGNGAVTYDIAGAGSLAEPNADRTTNFSYMESSRPALFQDGRAPGTLNSISISPDGLIGMIFTNGQNEKFGRVGLVNFINPQGLRKIGENMFGLDVSTRDDDVSITSGAPIIGWSTTTGNMKSGTKTIQYKLEGSNVELSTAMTSLIIHQRAYQADAKAFTTGDEIIQQTLQIKK